MRPRMLNVGSGDRAAPKEFAGYDETRVDIDPATTPDIVAPMTALGEIGTYDMVFCSHALEHVYPAEVPVALAEFRRVLNPGGAVVIFVPDLEGITATEDVLYMTQDGPVTGIDLIYGLRLTLKDCPYMAHHTGFVADTLSRALSDAGFLKVTVKRLENFNLMGIGIA